MSDPSEGLTLNLRSTDDDSQTGSKRPREEATESSSTEQQKVKKLKKVKTKDGNQKEDQVRTKKS